MPAAAPTALRVLVTLLAAVAVVSQVAYLDAISWHVLGLSAVGAQMSGPVVTVMTGHAAVCAVSAVLAVGLVLHEGPRESAARGLGLAMGAWSYLMAYSGVTLLLRPDPGFWRSVFEAHFLAIEVLGLVGLIRFTTLFPTPLFGQALEMPATLPAGFRPLHRASVWMLSPAAPWISGLLVLALLWSITAGRGQPIGDAGVSPIMDLIRFVAAGIVVLNLRRSWGRADPEGLRRLVWPLAGLAFLTGALLLLIGGNVLMAVTSWPEPSVSWRPLLIDAGLVGFLVALTMGVLYRGAIDAGQAASRIGALAAVATLGLFLAAALEALFTGGVLAGVSLRTGVGTLLAFVVVVATHRQMVRSIERLFSQMPGPQEA